MKKPTVLKALVSLFCLTAGIADNNPTIGAGALGLPAARLLTFSQPGPGLKDYGLKGYVGLSRDLPLAEDREWKLVCRMPYNCQFQPWVPVCLRHCLQWQATTVRAGPWTSHVTAPHSQEPLFMA